MTAYFAATTKNLEQNKENYNKILEILSELEISLFPSWVIEKLYGKKTTKSIEEIVADNNKFINNTDVVIVEATNPSTGVGYFISQALVHKKPLLCLFQHSSEEETLSGLVEGTKSFLVKKSKYTSNNLQSIIEDFVNSASEQRLQKFNFIATKQIVDFLEEGAVKAGKSKSEYLRDLIHEKIMNR